MGTEFDYERECNEIDEILKEHEKDCGLCNPNGNQKLSEKKLIDKSWYSSNMNLDIEVQEELQRKGVKLGGNSVVWLEDGLKAIKDERKQALSDVKKSIEKIINNYRMYADMIEDEFWVTSKISPEEADKMANYVEGFYEELKEQINKSKNEK